MRVPDGRSGPRRWPRRATTSARWVVAEDDDGPLAVLPFELRERRRGPLRLRVLGNERTSDGLLAHRARPAVVRIGAARRDGGGRRARRSRDTRRSARRAGFTRLATAATEGLTTEERYGGHSVIATTAPYDDWLAAAGRNLRAGLRKARNRFERRGEMTVTIASGPDEVAAAFDEFVTIEASGWKAATGALASRPRDRARLRRFLCRRRRRTAAVRTLRPRRQACGRPSSRRPPARRWSC